MRTVINDRKTACERAALQVKTLLSRKSDAVLALSAADSALCLYNELAEMYEKGELSFKSASFVSVCELEGTALCRDRLTDCFFNRTDANLGNCFFLTDKSIDLCEAELSSLGGIDLAILSMGTNARIGFNEPAVPYDSTVHSQLLAPATRRELAPLFGGEENVPDRGVTLGIKTLCDAREIILLAFGEMLSEPVYKMLYGRTDSAVPAAFLQIPANVAVYLDETAAAKL